MGTPLTLLMARVWKMTSFTRQIRVVVTTVTRAVVVPLKRITRVRRMS